MIFVGDEYCIIIRIGSSLYTNTFKLHLLRAHLFRYVSNVKEILGNTTTRVACCSSESKNLHFIKIVPVGLRISFRIKSTNTYQSNTKFLEITP